jgi:CrcB protein
MSWRLILGIAIGGASGALARAGLIELLDERASAALFFINVVGSFLLGVTVVRLVDSPKVREALGTGFFGAFTSMSTFAVDIASRLDGAEIGTALSLTAATVVCAVGGAALGMGMRPPT